MIRKLFPYMKKFRLQTILCPICIIGEVILEVYIPYLMANIVDIGIPARDINYIINQGLLMILMAFASLTFGALAARLGSVAGMGFGSELRRGLFEKIQAYSFRNMDKYNTASLTNRCTQDVTNIQNSFNMIIRMAFRSPFMFVSALLMAIKINPSLVTVFLVAIPVLVTAILIISMKSFPRFQAMLAKYDLINSSIQEDLIAVREVKAFVRSDHEKKKFEKANNENMRASIDAEKLLVTAMPLMMLVMNACTIAILWLGGKQIIAGTMLTGELMSFIVYIAQILMSLLMLSMVFVMTIMSKASMHRVAEVLDDKIDLTDEEAAGDKKVRNGSIEFRNVYFKYSKENKNYILDDISLDIKSGETIGIIGGTGSAKTTLVQLIPRLYDVEKGEVLVGGSNVKEYKIKDLRDAVSVVLQKNTLFSGTILDNLKWGDPNATQEEVEEACRKACAHDFICSFPKGYETDLGQGGVNVSGGQKQRLCIARALLKKPKILILDDSTSAVDTATDAMIRQELKKNLSDTTKIIIAQRITSVWDCDRIIVMDDGRINAIGTHEELLATNQIYSEVYNSQQKGVA
ncbi:MAG: ABC transporter ATP-binding protein [Clostridia bacterium]|jgi:ATP-binding cassette subfamily B protein